MFQSFRAATSIPRRRPLVALAAIVAVIALFSATVLSAAAVSLPAVTQVSPASGPIGGGTTVNITGSGFTGATSVSFGGSPATPVVNSDNSISVISPAHVAGVVDVTVTTSAGTSTATSADQFTYGSGPTVTAVSPATGPTSGGTLVTIFGSSFTGATSVSFGGIGATPTVISDSHITAISPAHVAGLVDVLVVTPGGTSAATASDHFTFGSSSAPVVTGISPAGGPVLGGTAVTIYGSGFTGATMVSFGGVAVVPTVLSDSSVMATSPSHAAGTVDVTVTTSLGTSFTSTADQFTYGSGPTVTLVSPSSGPTSGGTTVTIYGSGFTGATSVSFGGSLVVPTVMSDTQITAISPAHAAGTVDILVMASSGTSAVTTADHFTFGSTGAPVVTSINPDSGPVAGGTTVTIYGSGFTGATLVSFGGISVVPTVLSDTSIMATSPAHAAGTVDIVVTTSLGTSFTSTADQFTYGSGPIVSALSPSTGPVSGGTTVTITGTGFTGATAVTFDTTSVTPVVNSDTSITVTSPAHASGAVNVTVTTPAGTSPVTSAGTFTYGSSTVSYTLYFRWSLIVWQGPDGADIATALQGQETPSNPATNNVFSSVTAIFRYNGSAQKFEAYFPNGANVPGANDFTTFTKGQAYFIASSGPGTITWTALAG